MHILSRLGRAEWGAILIAIIIVVIALGGWRGAMVDGHINHEAPSYVEPAPQPLKGTR